MQKKFLLRASLIVAATILSIVYILPSTALFSSMPQWWKDIMPDKGIVLGLDLQGGVHLVYEVDGDKAAEITTERIAGSLTNIFNEEEIKADVKKEGMEIMVSPVTDDIKELVDQNYPNLDIVSRTE